MPDRPKSQCSFVYITRVTSYLTDGSCMISTFRPSGNQPRSVVQRPHGVRRRIHLFRWNHSFCNLHSARLQLDDCYNGTSKCSKYVCIGPRVIEHITHLQPFHGVGEMRPIGFSTDHVPLSISQEHIIIRPSHCQVLQLEITVYYKGRSIQNPANI